MNRGNEWPEKETMRKVNHNGEFEDTLEFTGKVKEWIWR